MKKEDGNPTKELYRQLRALTCEQLWDEEVARFNRATPRERMENVAVVRAVGVVFSEAGTESQKETARTWLRGLLNDPCEKIRRYAIGAFPKIGAGVDEEVELLTLLKTADEDRERKFLSHALEKIGGVRTLEAIENSGLGLQTRQKVKASVARVESPSGIRMDGVFPNFDGLKIHLRGRAGLEGIVGDEVKESAAFRKTFRVEQVGHGLVAMTPVAPFTLGDVYRLRCFGTVGFVLGKANNSNEREMVESLASHITSPLSRQLLKTFTDGSIRYRLNFVGKGHQRGAVRLIANRAFALCPEILNDARIAPWTISIYPAEQGGSVELSPKLVPDPRRYFRLQDIPAASHPPLAACMARLAGMMADEIVWDPFCGSGLELVERALLGGVRSIYGTDLSAEAIAIAGRNFAAAQLGPVESEFTCCDFRDFARNVGSRSVSLVITNPPLGKRVPIPDLRGLMEDLFSVAAVVLKPGGRLVFANPFRMESPERSLKLQYRQKVDFGGFNCWLEKYLKT